jgi:hypothetical protein
MGTNDSRPSGDHIKRARELIGILIPPLREIARRHGYALATHGSQERDIDLVAIPWTDSATGARTLIENMFIACKAIVGFASWHGGSDGEPIEGTMKPHGRLAWSIHLGSGPYLDISVLPRHDVSVRA